MSKIALKALQELEVSSFQIPAHGKIPNTSIQHHPLLIYRGAIPSTISANQIEKHLKQIGVVYPHWRYTMYTVCHFHATTHEVLCISQGSAKLLFGGRNNPSKVETTVEQGDVIVVPAGVSHRLLDDLKSGFEMIGSYPTGIDHWDMCYGRDDEEDKVKGIQHLGWFKMDPLYGEHGPVLQH